MPKKAGKIKAVLPAEEKPVLVNSGTYGRHLRAARGSKSNAHLNDVLAEQAGRTGTINGAAKAVYDVLKNIQRGL